MKAFHVSSLPLILIVVMSFSIGSVTSAEAARTQLLDDGWAVYHDELFDVSIEYPASWRVKPHVGLLDQGGVVTFSAPSARSASSLSDPHDGGDEIVFGPYLTALEQGMTVSEWRQKRQDLFAPYAKSESTLLSSEKVWVDEVEGLRTVEHNPLGLSRSTDIARGDMVWFLWDNGDETLTDIYDRMLASIRFGKGTPSSLQALYGDGFISSPLEYPEPQAAEKSLLLNFRVPLNGYNAAKCSNTHGSVYTKYAIDVFLNTGTQVYAAANGQVIFRDWSGNYGKLIKVNTEPHEHFYGHLSSYLYVYVGLNVNKGSVIALSGDTGLGDAHLHFEVRERYANVGVDMRYIGGFIENSNYPSQNGVAVTSCGYWWY